jgi:hypothetical protein
MRSISIAGIVVVVVVVAVVVEIVRDGIIASMIVSEG